jgi:hypothetical protein
MNPAFDSTWNTYVKDAMPIAAAMIGAFGGGVVSGFLVHVLTQSREREKWILDSKKEEYRELLSAMSNAYSATVSQLTLEVANKIAAQYNVEELRKTIDTQNHSLRIFQDRIFIVHDVNLLALEKRWVAAIVKYREDKSSGSVATLYSDYEAIRDEIVKAANRAIPKTAWQRLQFWKD